MDAEKQQQLQQQKQKEEHEYPDLLRRCLNVILLGLGWCCAMSGIFINISTTTLAATDWMGTATYSTFPIGAQLFCSAACVVPLYHMAHRLGRRLVFVAAAVCSAGGAAIMVAAAQVAHSGSLHTGYGLLVLGAFLQGPSFAVASNFRFVSAEFFTGHGYAPEWRARAISLTVGMAVFAAGIGPEAVRHVRSSLDANYSGAYVLLVGLYLGQALMSGLVQYGWLQNQQQQPAQQQQQQQQPTSLNGHAAPTAKQQQQTGGGMKPRQHQGLEPDGVNGHHQVLVVAPAEDLTAGDLAADGKQATQGDAAAPAKPTALVAPTLLQPLSGPDKGSQQQQQAAQQQPLGPLLASPHFWAPAVAGAVAFCNMAAVMVASPIMMNLDAHSFDESTYVIEGHVAGMYLPAVVVGDVIALLRALSSWAPSLLTPLLLLLPPCWSWRVHRPRPSTQAKEGTGEGKQVTPAGWAASSAPITTVMVFGGLVFIVADLLLIWDSSTGFGFYMSSLTLLGVGWALVYVGGSALVASLYMRHPHLKASVSSAMDVLVVVLAAGANTISGVLIRAMGRSSFMGLNLAMNAALTLLCLWYHLWAAAQHGRAAARAG